MISVERGVVSTISKGDGSKAVCVITPILQTDPLIASLENIQKSIPNNLPRILLIVEKTNDYSDMTDRTTQILLANLSMHKKTGNTVIILRWAYMIPPLEEKHTVVIGTRYLKDPDARMDGLEKELQAIGLYTLRDSGLYGGGQICHNLIVGLKHHSNVAVAEVTLSFSVVKDPVYVKEVLKSISELSR